MKDKYFELNQQINELEKELDKCVTLEQKLKVQNKLLKTRKDLLYKHIEYSVEKEGENEMKYKLCPKCGKKLTVDTHKQLLSSPPQYPIWCSNCDYNDGIECEEYLKLEEEFRMNNKVKSTIEIEEPYIIDKNIENFDIGRINEINNLVDIQNSVYIVSKEQIERAEFENWKTTQNPKEDEILIYKDKRYIFKNEEFLRLDEIQGNNLFFAKVRQTAKIPTKDLENMGYDVYANFEEDYMLICPHETKMIPTGICSACSEDYAIVLKERGSTGTKGIGQRCGVIDSGYRGEWFVPVTNTTNYPLIISKITDETELLTKAYGKIAPTGTIIYPYTKGICQAVVLPVPKMNVQEISLEELKSIPSNRKEGKIGSSGK